MVILRPESGVRLPYKSEPNEVNWERPIGRNSDCFLLIYLLIQLVIFGDILWY